MCLTHTGENALWGKMGYNGAGEGLIITQKRIMGRL
jgi:hypothetical protein